MTIAYDTDHSPLIVWWWFFKSPVVVGHLILHVCPKERTSFYVLVQHLSQWAYRYYCGDDDDTSNLKNCRTVRKLIYAGAMPFEQFSANSMLGGIQGL